MNVILEGRGCRVLPIIAIRGVKAHCRQVMGTMHAADLFISAFPDLSRMTARDIKAWVNECNL